MLKSFTLVKMKPGWTREAFFQRWCQHTRDWDLKDHPEISLNRLMLIEGDTAFAGIAENHWPDENALQEAAGWYATEAGRAHLEDLTTFMDIDNSPTVLVRGEALVDDVAGIRLLLEPGDKPGACR